MSVLKRMRWHKAGTIKLRLAQASEPMSEMKRPKPGTPAATRAMNSTSPIRIATKTALCVFELYLSLNEACKAITQTHCNACLHADFVFRLYAGAHVLKCAEQQGCS